jgi:hypothetical protein
MSGVWEYSLWINFSLKTWLLQIQEEKFTERKLAFRQDYLGRFSYFHNERQE